MPKSSNTTPAYNALFQEHTAPTIGKNKRTIVDTGQSCHVFAIVSAPNWETRDAVNKKYETIGTEKAMRRLQLQINHDLDEEDKKREDPRYVIQPYPRLTPEEIREERMFNMGEILKLRTAQTVLPGGICSFAEVFDVMIWFLNICGSKIIPIIDLMTRSLIAAVLPS
ncbi:hypothetical protein [Legionella cincinnatiensis]|uniref:hypothetical protein n=1 Tax=Legionella cincinnatiensis TaxID=28085 RepID=UPI0010415E45|nr:hypothetical protein [Legionella cincinnatiensis]